MEKKQAQKKQFPIKSFVMFFVLIVGVAVSIQYLDQIDEFLSNLEISMSTALANADTPPDKKAAPAKDAKAGDEKTADPKSAEAKPAEAKPATKAEKPARPAKKADDSKTKSLPRLPVLPEG